MLILLMMSGCVSAEKTEVKDMKEITLSSRAFENQGSIPSKYTCEGDNLSPPLSWSGIPEETVSLSLIMDDPDAPAGTFVHWVIYNLPGDKTGLPEAVPKDEGLEDGSLQGNTNYGRPGYGGPCPPPGRPHRYFFKLYALDILLDLPPRATKAEVEEAMDGHILGKGELIGMYGR